MNINYGRMNSSNSANVSQIVKSSSNVQQQTSTPNRSYIVTPNNDTKSRSETNHFGNINAVQMINRNEEIRPQIQNSSQRVNINLGGVTNTKKFDSFINKFINTSGK